MEKIETVTHYRIENEKEEKKLIQYLIEKNFSTDNESFGVCGGIIMLSDIENNYEFCGHYKLSPVKDKKSKDKLDQRFRSIAVKLGTRLESVINEFMKQQK